jgi:hypothetical protein
MQVQASENPVLGGASGQCDDGLCAADHSGWPGHVAVLLQPEAGLA